MELGRLGVWYPVDRLDAAGIRGFVGLVESLGYDAAAIAQLRTEGVI